MVSNEHPDMSGSGINDGYFCEECGEEFFSEERIHGSAANLDAIFCSSECVEEYEEKRKQEIPLKEILDAYEITLDCESPLEISSEEGRATGVMAERIIGALRILVFNSKLVFNQLDSKYLSELLKENLTIDKFTCHGCGLAEKCQYAFDKFNTNGDCLAEK